MIPKFRGMDLRGNWHLGLPCIVQQGERKGHYISNKAGMPMAFEIRPETLSQFTGLLDKNGVEIFDGDFMRRANGDSGKVFFNQAYASYDFAYKFKGSPTQILLAQIVSDAEIIGNIHQNRELLEQ